MTQFANEMLAMTTHFYRNDSMLGMKVNVKISSLKSRFLIPANIMTDLYPLKSGLSVSITAGRDPAAEALDLLEVERLDEDVPSVRHSIFVGRTLFLSAHIFSRS